MLCSDPPDWSTERCDYSLGSHGRAQSGIWHWVILIPDCFCGALGYTCCTAGRPRSCREEPFKASCMRQLAPNLVGSPGPGDDATHDGGGGIACICLPGPSLPFPSVCAPGDTHRSGHRLRGLTARSAVKRRPPTKSCWST